MQTCFICNTRDPELLPNWNVLSALSINLRFSEKQKVISLENLFSEGIPGESYVPWFIQIRDVIVRLGGPPIRLKIARIETELINLDLQQHYVKVRDLAV